MPSVTDSQDVRKKLLNESENYFDDALNKTGYKTQLK